MSMHPSLSHCHVPAASNTVELLRRKYGATQFNTHPKMAGIVRLSHRMICVYEVSVPLVMGPRFTSSNRTSFSGSRSETALSRLKALGTPADITIARKKFNWLLTAFGANSGM
jgi:hypothetical protein